MHNIRLLKEVAEGRYREIEGIYYDDFEVGSIIEHRPGRTVSDADNTWQSLLSHNNHPLHINEHYASQTEFGKIVVSSLVTLSIVGGLSTRSTSGVSIANLGWNNIRLVSPVFVGDTIYAETEIASKRLSTSRPGVGIVEFNTRGLKADGTIFMTFNRSALIPLCGNP
ncbi:UNVERIFIED_ORG: itaconyl-CoA hydratase [Methylobacterium sp. SuP10 SLI 274]|uniref:MaoC family dehydratase n=1 Tax=Methylorubrum extorquens TaxID=408 RepID=UPI00209EFB5B|nr:MaoC family dehydratase [Methylorubrum extorquens]MDF9866443.1 itaconyl-CoA hydratase [Methylorubrum pseudosasae]MDH6639952.1 itaconyl-CoA hydratase [Methylobacterium sp. SuP10 SLI 274]MDH6669320.1 itaconyl-CoA hydratase [Methylorubrum zatmanii]MCP1561915.1 itaconyl-CoA hydratase [Methylorubrum extorquens]MDF9794714.1 itaconyl-CoA hydratase [Methylorubrum extorquens]